MRELFNGWRRKVGILTLLLACLFVAGMMRALVIGDRIHAKLGDHHYCFISSDGLFRLTRYIADDPAPTVMWQSRPAKSGGVTDVVDEAPIMWIRHWIWYGFEVGYGDFRTGTVPISVFATPHWVAIPLTLLSAFLLLYKPRPSTPMKTDEPIAPKLD